MSRRKAVNSSGVRVKSGGVYKINLQFYQGAAAKSKRNKQNGSCREMVVSTQLVSTLAAMNSTRVVQPYTGRISSKVLLISLYPSGDKTDFFLEDKDDESDGKGVAGDESAEETSRTADANITADHGTKMPSTSAVPNDKHRFDDVRFASEENTASGLQ